MNSNVEIAREYYIRVDAGRAETLDLFTEDVELYFPKFGVAHGKDAFGQLTAGLFRSLKNLVHNQNDLRFIDAGDVVVVEGTTRGETVNGNRWSGGETTGGRFASIFDFRDGLISRMFIYLDPDYGSEDRDRFLWRDGSERRF